ncbi:MAG: DUF2804 domain-containing protein [Clostridia bacterium]|nr:DUF2804 domain-containing protein [Clostridia bacterium]
MSDRNHEVTKPTPLLDPHGALTEPGWARQLYWTYDRNAIRAPKFRIKEWDYYLVISEKGYGFAFTVSDDGYVGLESVSLLNFNTKWEHTETVLKPFTMGKLKLPSTVSDGTTSYRDKRLQMDFYKTPGKRRIQVSFKNFCDEKPLFADITLDEPECDKLVIATPWAEKKTAFYYNCKINCMRASGKVVFDGVTYELDPKTDFGTLDWGRGVWTYDNTWYWSSGNCDLDGHAFGFNLGYGFGDTSAASENIFFYDGVGSKLDDVTFAIPEKDGVKQYTDPWTFTSSDGRFYADFVPIMDRAAKIDLKVIISDQHQVFGRMTGHVVLDDGRRIEFRDLLCFAEDVHNKY